MASVISQRNEDKYIDMCRAVILKYSTACHYTMNVYYVCTVQRALGIDGEAIRG